MNETEFERILGIIGQKKNEMKWIEKIRKRLQQQKQKIDESKEQEKIEYKKNKEFLKDLEKKRIQ